MTFAAATERVNEAVFRHLVTHDAVLDSVAVSGIFDNGYSQVLAGVGGVNVSVDKIIEFVNQAGMHEAQPESLWVR